MKKQFLFICLGISMHAGAQELYVYTEPASNMAAKSVGIRIQNTLMFPDKGSGNEYNLIPELMWGISKNVMIHADGIFSDRSNHLKAVGGSVYLKYRFFSADDVHSHIRVACYGRAAWNNSPVNDRTINLQQQNSGYELGLVATALKHKVAVSLNASWLRANDNKSEEGIGYGVYRSHAMAASLSIGKLMLPREYTDYKQVNLNAMLEILGQVGQPGPDVDENSYVDMAPSLQLIFMSKMRVELGYRFPLLEQSDRMFNRGALLRLEYNFFNLY